MTKITYEKRGGLHRLTIEGHAGFAEMGKDVVCAGVSAIAFALLGWLRNHEEDVEYIQEDVGNGFIDIKFFSGKKAPEVFEMALIGLEQIAVKYPEYITITPSAYGGDARE